MACFGLKVQLMASGQDVCIFSSMPLCRTDILNTTVTMLKVIPMNEVHGPSASSFKSFKPLDRKLGTILGRPEQRLRVGVVIAHPWTGIRRFDPQPLQHAQHRRGLECGAVIPVQDGLDVQGCNAFTQRSACLLYTSPSPRDRTRSRMP